MLGGGWDWVLPPAEAFFVVHDFQSEENYLILELRNEVACFVSSTTCADRVLSFDWTGCINLVIQVVICTDCSSQSDSG